MVALVLLQRTQQTHAFPSSQKVTYGSAAKGYRITF